MGKRPRKVTMYLGVEEKQRDSDMPRLSNQERNRTRGSIDYKIESTSNPAAEKNKREKNHKSTRKSMLQTSMQLTK